MKKLFREGLSYWLMNCSISVMPDSPEKIEMCKAVVRIFTRRSDILKNSGPIDKDAPCLNCKLNRKLIDGKFVICELFDTTIDTDIFKQEKIRCESQIKLHN